MSIYNFLTTDNLLNLLTNTTHNTANPNDRVIHNNAPNNYNDNTEYHNLVEYIRASERFYSESNIRYNINAIMDELNFASLSVYSDILETDFDNFLNNTFDDNLETFPIESFFDDKTVNVKIIQTNTVTRVTFQFKGPVDHRFENLKSLYKEICHQEIKTGDSN